MNNDFDIFDFNQSKVKDFTKNSNRSQISDNLSIHRNSKDIHKLWINKIICKVLSNHHTTEKQSKNIFVMNEEDQ